MGAHSSGQVGQVVLCERREHGSLGELGMFEQAGTTSPVTFWTGGKPSAAHTPAHCQGAAPLLEEGVAPLPTPSALSVLPAAFSISVSVMALSPITKISPMSPSLSLSVSLSPHLSPCFFLSLFLYPGLSLGPPSTSPHFPLSLPLSLSLSLCLSPSVSLALYISLYLCV